MSAGYIDERGFPTWADVDEVDLRHLEEEARWAADEEEYLERLYAATSVETEREADYSGDRLLDGPDRNMFDRPIY